ncbi:MAG: 4Fe-4S binding protein [Desulfobacteraceae bacterium]|nr:4Fe-4S binding protein [Desulfobacteraceae bacterium]
MKWEKDAQKAIQKVPFFVRKKVKARVEKEAGNAGKIIVSLADVKATQNRFLNKMDAEIKGYQLDACFGSNGCPNQIFSSEIQSNVEALLKKEDLLGFLRKQVKGDLKFHHEFRITVSDCPNACSQPQIKDIGIIGAQRPFITEIDCIGCMECVNICKEGAISIDSTKNNGVESQPVIDFQICVKCGQCIDVCPTKTIDTDKMGYRILVGGKLGRHPRLAEELPGIYSETEVLDVIRQCIRYYKTNSQNGERFAEIVSKDKSFVPELIAEYPK